MECTSVLPVICNNDVTYRRHVEKPQKYPHSKSPLPQHTMWHYQFTECFGGNKNIQEDTTI